jgi:predicted small lipoprotein YifL
MAMVLALALTAPLAGCGKKGDLEAPPGKTVDHPKKYPR